MGNLVSVIIPTYKRPQTLIRTIESVLQQTYKNIEVLVVDDNDPAWESRKMTENLMQKYIANERVKYIKHDKNINGSAARNTGFKNSSGDYIMFLDDDDEYFPRKVEAQLSRLESLDKSWGVCYCGYIRKKDGKTIVHGAEKREGNLLKDALMRNLFIHAGSNLMIRREVVQEVQGFDESFTRNQDIEFLARILMKYKIAYVNEMGLIVHTHSNEATKDQFDKITMDYLNKFSSYIEELSPRDREEFQKMIRLQIFRNKLTSSNKRKQAFNMLSSKELSRPLVLRYLLHLAKRKLTKKAYGFKISKT